MATGNCQINYTDVSDFRNVFVHLKCIRKGDLVMRFA